MNRPANHNANIQRKNRALWLAGVLAIATACYHAKTGDDILREIAMSDDDMEFVTGTYQLGTMGWIAGGALLIGTARLAAQDARNLIVIVAAVLFGIPAFGTLALTGGEITGGGIALAGVVVLALYGRKLGGGAQVAPALVHPRGTIERDLASQ